MVTKIIAIILATIGYIIMQYGIWSKQKHDIISYSIVLIGLSVTIMPIGVCAINLFTVAGVIAVIAGILLLIAGITGIVIYNKLIKDKVIYNEPVENMKSQNDNLKG